MKDHSKSDFIFDLVDEFEMFSATGAPNIFTDEALIAFSYKYKSFSTQRDISLLRYLNQSPSLFRSIIPYSKWALGVAFNVVWYYDELIVNDPIIQILEDDHQSIENKKQRLRNVIVFLLKCKETINEGYILFAGNDLLPITTGNFENEAQQLLDSKDVTDAYEQITVLLRKNSPLNDIPEDDLTQLQAIYESFWGEVRQMGMHIPEHVQGTNKLDGGIFYDFTTPFQYTTKDQILLYGKENMLTALHPEYKRDISVVLETLRSGSRLNSPVLFYRDADAMAAKNYSLINQTAKPAMVTNNIGYDCIVPYLDNIHFNQLLDVKRAVPNAFKDFRYYLFELVSKTMKLTDDPHELKFRIDSQINSMIRKMEIEMESAKRKMVIHGIVAPVVVAAGSLGLFTSGMDVLQVAGAVMGTSGAVATLRTLSDVKSDKDKAIINNQMYFLWKVLQ